MSTAATPSPEMMAVPVALAEFIARGGRDLPPDLLTPEIVIVENFAPFLFRDAASWAAAMRAHLAGASGLAWSFGPPQDFGRDGDTVYFALPTTWRGESRGVPFCETGGWALVLKAGAEGWRLAGYGWAVIETTCRGAS
jgi:hypothetical protein